MTAADRRHSRRPRHSRWARSRRRIFIGSKSGSRSTAPRFRREQFTQAVSSIAWIRRGVRTAHGERCHLLRSHGRPGVRDLRRIRARCGGRRGRPRRSMGCHERGRCLCVGDHRDCPRPCRVSGRNDGRDRRGEGGDHRRRRHRRHRPAAAGGRGSHHRSRRRGAGTGGTGPTTPTRLPTRESPSEGGWSTSTASTPNTPSSICRTTADTRSTISRPRSPLPRSSSGERSTSTPAHGRGRCEYSAGAHRGRASPTARRCRRSPQRSRHRGPRRGAVRGISRCEVAGRRRHAGTTVARGRFLHRSEDSPGICGPRRRTIRERSTLQPSQKPALGRSSARPRLLMAFQKPSLLPSRQRDPVRRSS